METLVSSSQSSVQSDKIRSACASVNMEVHISFQHTGLGLRMYMSVLKGCIHLMHSKKLGTSLIVIDR